LSVVPDKPGVDDRAIVPTDKFRNLERPKEQERRPLEIIAGVDNQPFISPDKFNKLNQVQPMARTEEGDVEMIEDIQAPRVLVPLKDANVEELMPVVLTTKIEAGAPMSTVRIPRRSIHCNERIQMQDIGIKILPLDVPSNNVKKAFVR
jgi:hypothetical protein